MLQRETQEPCHLWKKTSFHGRELGRGQEGLCELVSAAGLTPKMLPPQGVAVCLTGTPHGYKGAHSPPETRAGSEPPQVDGTPAPRRGPDTAIPASLSLVRFPN